MCVHVCVCAPHPCRLDIIPERGSRMRIGTGLLIHFRGTGIVVKKKRERREEGAEIGRRWRRGNGANRVDKSGCRRRKKNKAERGEKKGKWKWGDGVEIKAKGRRKVEGTWRTRRKEVVEKTLKGVSEN